MTYFPLFLALFSALSFFDFFLKNVLFHLILTLITQDNRLRQIFLTHPH